MKKKSFLALGVGVLLAGSVVVRLMTPAPAKAQTLTGCTLADVEGSYGFQFDGWVQAAPGQFVPFAETGEWNVGAQGRMTGVSKFSYGGQYYDHTFEGTVQINADCTGASVVPQDSLGFKDLKSYWVVVRPNQEIIVTSLTGVGAVNGKMIRRSPESQLDRMEEMLRSMSRTFGLVFPHNR